MAKKRSNCFYQAVYDEVVVAGYVGNIVADMKDNMSHIRNDEPLTVGLPVMLRCIRAIRSALPEFEVSDFQVDFYMEVKESFWRWRDFAKNRLPGKEIEKLVEFAKQDFEWADKAFGIWCDLEMVSLEDPSLIPDSWANGRAVFVGLIGEDLHFRMFNESGDIDLIDGESTKVVTALRSGVTCSLRYEIESSEGAVELPLHQKKAILDKIVSFIGRWPGAATD